MCNLFTFVLFMWHVLLDLPVTAMDESWLSQMTFFTWLVVTLLNWGATNMLKSFSPRFGSIMRYQKLEEQ